MQIKLSGCNSSAAGSECVPPDVWAVKAGCAHLALEDDEKHQSNNCIVHLSAVCSVCLCELCAVYACVSCVQCMPVRAVCSVCLCELYAVCACVS